MCVSNVGTVQGAHDAPFCYPSDGARPDRRGMQCIPAEMMHSQETQGVDRARTIPQAEIGATD